MYIHLLYVYTEQFAHLSFMCNLLGIFVSDTYMTITCEVDVAIGYGWYIYAVYICGV